MLPRYYSLYDPFPYNSTVRDRHLSTICNTARNDGIACGKDSPSLHFSNGCDIMWETES